MKKASSFAVLDIEFYALDDEGEIIENEKGEIIVYKLKDGVRYKPLEYLCEDMEAELMEVSDENI